MEAVSSQTDVMTVRPAKEGWRIYAVSNDNVSLIDVHIDSSEFDGYEVGDPFAVRTEPVLKALKYAAEDTELIIGSNLSVRSGDMVFETPIILPDLKEPKLPKMSGLTASATIGAGVFAKVMALTDRKHVDAVRLTINGAGVTMQATDKVYGGVMVTVRAEDCISLDGDAEAVYPLSSWAEFLKAVGDIMIEVRSGDSYPAVVEFGDTGWKALWMVAPRIEDE